MELEDFCDQAICLSEDILSKSQKLGDYANFSTGRWHPNGFAIFDVGFYEELGYARFHIWPLSPRVKLRNHPQVHNHGFHLYSTIVEGGYSEAMYELVDVDSIHFEHSVEANEYFVRSSGLTNLDSVESTDTTRQLYSTGIETFQKGTSHIVAAGQLHETLIPDDMFCATLAIMGIREHGFVDSLYGEPGFDGEEKSRQLVDRSSALMMIEQGLS